MMIDDYAIPVVSLDGYQVIPNRYFNRLGQQSQPAMTIWETSVSFNIAAHNALNNCEAVLIEVHPGIHSVAVLPVSSGSPDSVNWKKTKANMTYRRLESAKFGRKLYGDWGLNTEYRYTCLGKIAQCDKKVVLVFTFSDYDLSHGIKVVKEANEE